MLPIYNLNSCLPKRGSNRSLFIKWQSVDIFLVNRKFKVFLSKNRERPRIIHLKSYLSQNTLYYLSTVIIKDQCFKELCFRALAQQILLFCSLLGILFSVTLVWIGETLKTTIWSVTICTWETCTSRIMIYRPEFIWEEIGGRRKHMFCMSGFFFLPHVEHKSLKYL